MNYSQQFSLDARQIQKGTRLTAKRSVVIEKRVLAHPDDATSVVDRLQLIGYWFLLGTAESTGKLFENLFWFIKHCPERTVWRDPIMNPRRCASDFFERGKQLWVSEVSAYPTSAAVVGNAGRWIISMDFDAGERLLCRATELEPMSWYWSKQLNLAYYDRLSSKAGQDDISLALKCVQSGENFLKHYDLDYAPAVAQCLEFCFRSALMMEDDASARKHAQQHLDLTQTWSNPSHMSDATLGLVALHIGDLAEARNRLLSLKENSLTDELDLKLANELLEAGDMTSVIEYLRLCKSFGFWKRINLDKWIEQLQRGERPKLTSHVAN